METSTETEIAGTVLIQPENQLDEIGIDDLPEGIHEAAVEMGWPSLMPVQARGIPYLMADREMIIQSHTGSGKTGAFLIPLILKVDPDYRHTQALVLVPTRELASQVFKEFEGLTRQMDISGVCIYGGVGYGGQFDALRDGAQVVIGTPGRVLDHLGRRSLSLETLRILVFDEADEMLSMGFYPAMMELKRYLPRQRRTWMFSATMPYKVQSLAREFLREPEFLSLSAGHVSVNTMEHRYYMVPAMEKDLMLMRLIEMENPESAIIFCNMKTDVEYVSTVLQNRGYNADQISGNLDQKAREKAMQRIRNRETRFLVATDVAARGIDISDLSHVFQYDVPKDPDSYIHRAGRTARAGNTGVGVTLASNMSEKSDLKKITRKYDVDFVELPIPSQEEVEERIAERVVVLLEERMRQTQRTARDRMKRMEGLVQSLAESEDERILLAMLLDELYHSTFHESSHEPSEQQPEQSAKSDKPAKSQKSARPAKAKQPSRSEKPGRSEKPAEQPSAESNQPVSDAASADEGEPKKKKRRRRKKKPSGDGGE
jgi:ATP-dependent RNA helicase DeaD